MRLSLVTRKGLGDLIRENKGIKASLLIFSCLFISNMGNIIVNVAAFKTTAHMLNLPAIPLAAAMIAITFLFVTKGTYKITQNIMLVSCFFISPIFSAFKSNPNWPLALTNLAWPHGINFDSNYLKTVCGHWVRSTRHYYYPVGPILYQQLRPR